MRRALVPAICCPDSPCLQTSVTREPDSAQTQRPLVKGSLSPTIKGRVRSFTLGQYHEAANAAETQKKAFDDPVKEQTVVFLVQQDHCCGGTCRATKPENSGGRLSVMGVFFLLQTKFFIIIITLTFHSPTMRGVGRKGPASALSPLLEGSLSRMRGGCPSMVGPTQCLM